MRLRPISTLWLLVALSFAGISHADSPPAVSPPTTPLQFVLLPPPPPPPPTCASICTQQYQWCLAGGTNFAFCMGKYNYCVANCGANPPIFTP